MSASSDRRFVIVLAGVLGGLVSIALALIVIASLTTRGVEGQPGLQTARLSERLAPLAAVATEATAQPTNAASAAGSGAPALSGAQVVQQVCSACHSAGVLGAPKIGDGANWGARFKAAGGVDGLAQVALHGKGNMPPKGGDAALTEDQVKVAVQYMLAQSGIKH
ncbi:MAG: cytochrome c5 family protein [Gammaproteobacteria bacterium]|nr:cytochrome c5 family protein [Gammaproteobacteria bacterium]